MATKKGPKGVTDEHKAAMAEGRNQGRIVRDYLEALRANKPKRGRKRSADDITARIKTIEDALTDATPIEELQLVQERRDLSDELDAMTAETHIETYEEPFVRIAADYGKRKGISYQSWRDVGVSAAVLKQAGIGRNA